MKNHPAPRKTILDMDPGVDDAMAIILALRSPELRVEAICTVSGNSPADAGAENAAKILANVLDLPLGAQPPIFPGTARSLAGVFDPAAGAKVHGRDGLGETFLPLPRENTIRREPAEEALVRLVRENPGEITVIATGPLTNLARADQRDSGFSRDVREIIVMGGAYGVAGNITPRSEFNFHLDPEAAKIVLNSGARLTLVGLDVTHQVPFQRSRRDRLLAPGGKAADFIRRITDFYMDFYREIENLDGCYLHDPLAVGVAIDRGFVGTRKMKVDVETKGEITRGESVADFRPFNGIVPNADVCVSVDSARFVDFFTGRVSS